MSERERYAEFIRAIYDGQEPFPWQADLAERLVAGDIPSTIDVPTGLGKTRLIATWLYALGRQLASGVVRSLPLRLMFVVDRRVIVDAVSTEGRRLRSVLESSNGSTVSAEIGEALKGSTDTPLEVTTMRGGLNWDAVWLGRPDQPALVLATVDQFGSRLLFRGYGTSDRLRPIDAALVGTDSWLVVDEAHIAKPLVETSAIVASYQGIEDVRSSSGIRPLRVTRMSATTDADAEALSADLDAQITSSEFPVAADVAQKRIEESKPARLIELAYHRGTPKRWRSKVPGLGKDVAAIALRHHVQEGVTGVVCNTIAVARAVHRQLAGSGNEAILLIGRGRDYEKSIVLKDAERVLVGADDRPEGKFVVATQTVEVGADFDFDVLVTEAAPISSLIQRFGRVNRIGARQPQPSAIVYAPVAHDDDPVYGDATRATWDFLSTEASPWSVGQKRDLSDDEPSLLDSVDFGVRAIQRWTDRLEDWGGLNPKATFFPVANGSHFERWAATAPSPLQDVDVAPFLRGIEKPSAEVSVAWRLPPPVDDVEASGSLWGAWLTAQPPTTGEFVEVPIYEFRNLLSGGKPLPTGDVEPLVEGPEADEPADDESVVGVVWFGDREQPRRLMANGLVEQANSEPARSIRPGDRVVLNVAVGGHDQWGWTGERGEPVTDVGDIDTRGTELVWRRSVRLDSRVLKQWFDDEVVELLAGEDDSESIEIWEESDERLLAFDNSRFGLDTRKSAARSRRIELGENLDTGVRIVNLPRGKDTSEDGSCSRPRSSAGAISDDSVEGTSLTELGRKGSLPSIYSHGRSVGENAREFARNLGLGESLIETVGLAGEWHDLGKADDRFQVMLAGDRLEAMRQPEPLAKSEINARSWESRRRARESGLPRGFRHEAVSARLVDRMPDELVPADVDLELLHHLVVSHHGNGRPLLPPILDERPPNVSVSLNGGEVAAPGVRHQVDWEQPARFARLNQRYGWWGLAFLESIVRLADMKASAEGR